MKLLSALALMVMLSSCGSRDCSRRTIRSASLPDVLMVRKALSRVAEAPQVHVLVLSGGGSYGAFGAGVLRGWRDAGRPQFSVVTGVSTGALLATHAFLGELRDDATLETVYTTVSNSDIFTKRPFWKLPFSGSIATLRPLERLIARHVHDGVIDRVAQAGPRRRLYVATTNLDEGRLKIWDLTALAQARAYERYRAVLLASAAVPALYPCVELDGALHCDGGVREQLFVRRVMLELVRAGTRSLNVHVILNGKVSTPAACTELDLLSLAGRSVSVLAASAGLGNLLQSKVVAESNSASWRLMRIPERVEIRFDAQEFAPGPMRQLYEEGVLAGSGLWEVDMPELLDS